MNRCCVKEDFLIQSVKAINEHTVDGFLFFRSMVFNERYTKILSKKFKIQQVDRLFFLELFLPIPGMSL